LPEGFTALRGRFVINKRTNLSKFWNSVFFGSGSSAIFVRGLMLPPCLICGYTIVNQIRKEVPNLRHQSLVLLVEALSLMVLYVNTPMATQAQIIPEKQTASSIDNSAASKIQERINVLDRKVVFWNNANLLWVLITVVAGVAAFATQYLASVRQKELSGVQAELSAEKDRLLTEKDKQLAADLKSKDLAIAKANDDAAHSNERAAEAIKIA
jgi:hypothetical protein